MISFADFKYNIKTFIYWIMGLNRHLEIERAIEIETKQYLAEANELIKLETLRNQLFKYRKLGLFETMICNKSVDRYDNLSLRLRVQGSEYLSNNIRNIHRTR
jgi:hypothetical protein